MKRLTLTLTLLCSLTLNYTYCQATYTYGKFTGTGSNQLISGLTFSPDAIILKSEDAYGAYFATIDMGNKAKNLSSNNNLESNVILNWGATDFIVGSADDYNKLGVVTHWIAFDNANDIFVGSYTGNDGAIDADVGFAPEVVLIVGDGTGDGERGILANSSQSTATGALTATGTNISSMINLDATGFVDAGSSQDPDNSGIDYYFIAFNNGDNSSSGNYNPGAGSPNYQVSGPGWQPDFVITRSDQDGKGFVFKTASMNVGASASFQAESMLTDGINEFNATGFTLFNDNDRVQDNWNDHDYFAAKGGSEVLPIELLSFEAYVVNKAQTLIKWSTATELNNDYFEVQRSDNGLDFQTIQTIAGAGNSDYTRNYTYIDKETPKGKVYYRLKQVDFDGNFEVFGSKLIVNGSNEKIEWFHTATPENQKIKLTGNLEGNYNIKMFDLSGKVHLEQNHSINNQLNHLDVDINNDISKGIYLVAISSENGYQSTGKIMIK